MIGKIDFRSRAFRDLTELSEIWLEIHFQEIFVHGFRIEPVDLSRLVHNFETTEIKAIFQVLN